MHSINKYGRSSMETFRIRMVLTENFQEWKIEELDRDKPTTTIAARGWIYHLDEANDINTH